jgi:hypothetical protein
MYSDPSLKGLSPVRDQLEEKKREKKKKKTEPMHFFLSGPLASKLVPSFLCSYQIRYKRITNT